MLAKFTQHQKIARKLIVAPSAEIVSPHNTYEKLGIPMETYEFCKIQSLMMLYQLWTRHE